MLGTFFRTNENSLHPAWMGAKWMFKAHAEQPFWRWVCSWARAMRKPSDMGYDDSRFVLPPIGTRQHIVERLTALTDSLFVMPAITMQEQREERRITLNERCEKVAALLSHKDPALAWCHLNDEGDLLARLIPGAVQIQGSDSDEFKEESWLAFCKGQIRAIVSKPKIGGLGLNLQHCAHMAFFPSHSYEQYYQAVRRCYRFGQKRPVTVDIVTTEGETNVLRNLERKAAAADEMFDSMVAHMNDALGVRNLDTYEGLMEVPAWL
jgi:hypothetical protein